MVFEHEGTSHLVGEAGASPLMVGADVPHPWPTPPMDRILQAPGASDADKAAIVGGSAACLLGIAARLP